MKKDISTWLIHILPFLLLCALGVGCASSSKRVLLDPPANTGLEQEYYGEHKPRVVQVDALKAPYVILGSGQRVVDARDLIPAVGRSPTAKFAESGARLKKSAITNYFVAGGLITGGGVGLVSPLVYLVTIGPEGDIGPGDLGVIFGMFGVSSALMLGGLIPLFVGQKQHVEANQDIESAFLTYEGDLRKRLGLPENKTPNIVPARSYLSDAE